MKYDMPWLTSKTFYFFSRNRLTFHISETLLWLPIDDIIGIKKLCMMFKIVNKECPDYFTSYRTYIKNAHSYNTRLSSNNALAVPNCRSNAALRTFRPDNNLKNMTDESNFKTHLLESFLNINASRKHFSFTRTFQGTFLIFFISIVLY